MSRPRKPPKTEWTFPADEFVRAWRNARVATATIKGYRPHLEYVNVELWDHMIQFVACDSYIMLRTVVYASDATDRQIERDPYEVGLTKPKHVRLVHRDSGAFAPLTPKNTSHLETINVQDVNYLTVQYSAVLTPGDTIKPLPWRKIGNTPAAQQHVKLNPDLFSRLKAIKGTAGVICTFDESPFGPIGLRFERDMPGTDVARGLFMPMRPNGGKFE